MGDSYIDAVDEFNIPGINDVMLPSGRTMKGISTLPRFLDKAVKESILKNRQRSGIVNTQIVTKITNIINHLKEVCENRTSIADTKRSCSRLKEQWSGFLQSYENGTIYGGKSRRNRRHKKYNKKTHKKKLSSRRNKK
jgi:hypothetical protein